MEESRTRSLVCIVVGQLGFGGLEKQAFLLAQGLARRDFDARVVSLSAGGAWGHAFRESGIPLLELHRGFRFDLRRLVALVRLFRSTRPDLVYAFNYPTTVYARLGGVLAGVPVLVTGERCVYMNRWHGMLERALMRVTECVICNAEAVRRDLVERIGLPSQKVITVPNAILPPPQWTPSARGAARASLGLHDSGIVAGTLARLEEQKNIPMLVEAAARLKKMGVAIRFCVVGGGGQEAVLRRQIRERGLDKEFVLVGERFSASDLLPAFDIFVLSSRFEGLPNSLMEAMAIGLPSVCTAVDGCCELLEEGKTGFLVPSRDAGAMAEAVRRLALDPALRASMGAKARERILSEYSLDRLIGETERIFRSLLVATALAPRGRRLSVRPAAASS